MDVHQNSALLGGLSPATFMRRHWQKKPLLVRQAWPGVAPPLSRPQLFALAAGDAVESRLVERRGAEWKVRDGPLPRRALPPLARAGWTLLVQGLDLHVAAAHAMLARFRFVPDARLDDLMVSWASPGGGVGAHVDSYDVFLLQVQGRRRWRVGRARDAAFQPGQPLKLLRNFEPTSDWLLEPGDMLYLPPGWGHDGVAEGGDCMTCSIGFRSPAADELARELLLRLADEDDDCAGAGALYRDPRQDATPNPGRLPAPLLEFAAAALQRRLADPQALPRALGEWLTEPKSQVWFTDENVDGHVDGSGNGSGADAPATATVTANSGVRLDRRTRMLYDDRHVFINGEAFVASGRDAVLIRGLADRRGLGAAELERLSAGAAALLGEWAAAGWLHRGWE